MVALFHSGQATYINESGQQVSLVEAAQHSSSLSLGGIALRVIGNGHGAVIFFFVLSGFVLTMMLKRGAQQTSLAWHRFAIGRVFRIYPAIVSTLIIFTAVFVFTGRSTAPSWCFQPLNLFLNALLIRHNVNGVMWSLQVEMLAVPLIFVAFLACRRWGMGSLGALTILFVIVSFSKSWNQILGPQLNIALYSFLAGAIAFERGQRLIDKIGAVGGLTIGLAGFALARPIVGWWSNWSVIFETIFAAFIVLSLAYGQWRISPLWSPLRFMGKISYSFYLLHALTLVVLWQSQAEIGSAVAAGWVPGELALGLFAVSSLAIVPVAWLQYRLIELPGISLGRYLLVKMKNKRVNEGNNPLGAQ